MKNVFIRPDQPTLLEVRNRIQDDPHLSSSRRSQVCSAINKLGQVCAERSGQLVPGSSPHQRRAQTDAMLEMMPANVASLRPKIADIEPAEHGIKPKRFSTIKSDLMYGLKHVGAAEPGSYLAPIEGPWLKLRGDLPNKYAHTNLSRLFRYCSAREIAPDDVTDDVLEGFRGALESETFVKDPRLVHQNAARVWNQMIGQVKGWPAHQLTVPHFADHYILDWSAFPKEFRAAVEAYCDRLGPITPNNVDDILDLDRPNKPLKPRTIKQHRYDLRRSASILVHRGHAAENITSLEYLVEHTRDIAKFLLERAAKRTEHQVDGAPLASRTTFDTLSLLAKVAKHEVKSDPETVAKIRELAAHVKPPQGLSRRNRRRLAPLRDERNLVRLFALPDQIRKSLEAKESIKRDDALLMQLAVALAILTYAPLRIGNLASLHRGAHLHTSWMSGAARTIVDIDGTEVKNGRSLSFPLPKKCLDLIELYLRKYRPKLTTDDNPFLFPGPLPDRSKRSDTLGKQLTRLIHRAIGLKVNPHLYRHLVHIIVLHRFPGAYALVSRVLGHKSIQTAISNYAGEDIGIAMRAFQELVSDVANGASIHQAHVEQTAYGLNAEYF